MRVAAGLLCALLGIAAVAAAPTTHTAACDIENGNIVVTYVLVLAEGLRR
jgi:hypothetical protein